MFHKISFRVAVFVVLTTLCQINVKAQVVGGGDTLIIDRVIAVVGNKPVTQYDLEARYLQTLMTGQPTYDGIKCELLEELMINKLMVIQCEIDSIEVSDDEVQRIIDSKLQYEVMRMGSEENLEKMYKKTILEIKKDLFESAQEQELVRQMYNKITGSVAITPSEVQKYFKKVPSSEIPLRPETVELKQIVLKPRVSEDERTRIINRLNELRDRILNGEDMATLAVLYSEDMGTATRGGELGLASRNELDPAYAGAAFNLKGNEISRPVKSEFGYHIIQTIERRGDLINTRHILLQPKPTIENKLIVKQRLDSIAKNIRQGKYTFDLAVYSYSEDTHTANNFGILTDEETNQPKIELSKLSPEIMIALRNLKVGEISDPFESMDERGNPVYKIIMLKSRNPAHRTDMKSDYDFIQNLALQDKKEQAFNQWVDKTIKTTFHRMDPDFAECEFAHEGWNRK